MQETFSAENGFDLKYAPATNLDQKSQIDAFTSFVDEGVDVILLSATEGAGWEESLARAQEAEIPVVLIDRGIEPDDPSLVRHPYRPGQRRGEQGRRGMGRHRTSRRRELLRAGGPCRRRCRQRAQRRLGLGDGRSTAVRQGRCADGELVGRGGQERDGDRAQGQRQRHPAGVRPERRDGSRCRTRRRGSGARAGQGRVDRHDRRHQGGAGSAGRRTTQFRRRVQPVVRRHCGRRGAARPLPANPSSRTSSCRAARSTRPKRRRRRSPPGSTDPPRPRPHETPDPMDTSGPAPAGPLTSVAGPSLPPRSAERRSSA